MWCGVLGPLIVRSGAGEPITIGGPARRLLFAALVSRAGHPVSAPTLIEDIWGHVPPRSASKTLQSHMVRLRHDLGRDEAQRALVTDPAGYRLVLGPEELDADEFVARTERAGRLLVEEDAPAALVELDAALALWRGDAYEEFADAPFCVGERVRLFELRAHAEEERTDIALSLGGGSDLVAELEKRLAGAPYRERSWEQLILALYRAGRQADALAAYRRARAVLAEDLGVDPGPRLQLLEEQILQQDPSLLAAPAARSAARPLSGRRGVCPYRGLASYSDADADLFVGRERLTAELVGRLADHRVVTVVGASGVGKSSLVRAGLVPALRGGALPGSAAWRSAVVTPVDLLGTATGELDVLVVDQGEDLFVQLAAAQRAEVVDRLERLERSGGRIVLVLRGDFYGRLAELQPLGAYAEAATILIGPLREDDVRRVIEEPATRAGLAIDADLVDAVLDDIARQPFALPLLSAALVRTWENRDGESLTLDGYRRGGGVASALEKTAEDVYRGLSDAHRAVARRLLLRMAEPEGSGWIRRPIRRADTALEPGADEVVARLADARLITVAQERVDITHDALLVHWPRLRSWLEERVLAAELLDHLAGAGRAWLAAGRQASDLYRGARLQSALGWCAAHPDDVSEVETEFLDASAAAADAELVAARAQLAQEARGRRRLRAVAIGLAVAAAVALGGVAIALRERGSADRSAHRAEAAALTADARRLAALAVTAPDIATSSLLAVAAYRLQDSAETRGALLTAVERNQSALFRLAAPHRLLRMAVTPDGAYVAATDNRGQVLVYDTAARRLVARMPLGDITISGITADASEVLVSTFGGPDAGHVTLVDVPSGQDRQVLTTDADVNGPEPVISPDGRWLAVLTTTPRGAGDAVAVFDGRDWSAPARRFAVPREVSGLAVARDTVAVRHADGTVEVRELPSLRRIAQARFEPGGFVGPPGLALSPDGARLAVVEADGQRVAVAQVSDLTDRVELPTQPERVSVLAFAPDGAAIAVARFDGALAVYGSRDGGLITTLPGHVGPVFGLAWSGQQMPAGLYSIGLDSQFVSWSVAAGPRLVTESGRAVGAPDRGSRFGNFVIGVTPLQEGHGSAERLYRADLTSGSWAAWPLGLVDDEYVNQAVAADDGRQALVSIQDSQGNNRIEIWDLDAGRKTGLLDLPPNSAAGFRFGFDAAITPDGRQAFSSIGTDRVGVFDLPSGRYRRQFEVNFAQPNAAGLMALPLRFDPQGHLVVAGIDTAAYRPNHRLALIEPESGAVVAEQALGDIGGPSALDWSPTGAQLAVGTLDGTVLLDDAESLDVLATAGAVEPGFVGSVSFAPDGRTLVEAGTSGALTFLAVPDLTRVGNRVAVGTGANNGGMLGWYTPDGAVAGFAPDLRRPGSSIQRWYEFRADPADLARTACELAGADITRAQWQRYLGNRPYQSVCPD